MFEVLTTLLLAGSAMASPSKLMASISADGEAKADGCGGMVYWHTSEIYFTLHSTAVDFEAQCGAEAALISDLDGQSHHGCNMTKAGNSDVATFSFAQGTGELKIQVQGRCNDTSNAWEAEGGAKLELPCRVWSRTWNVRKADTPFFTRDIFCPIGSVEVPMQMTVGGPRA
ncbi:hypothetical protein DCS_04111 [Drechmeria coniospora]|uniref:AA1-like domain-containing protein n=1 Tax=Drechmeria coniospora TaxID=98403 RepID=A0A151GJ30_DRECN|nr:hypothetical protein DCS_04111 [Drechmeria coniospora]KYK57104.1 hypothetical protein DCS_04111 [Drechmeria coniospora]